MSGKFVSLIEKSRVIESSRSRYSSHCQISHYKDLSDKKFLEKLIADYKDLNPVDSRGAAIAQAGVIYMATCSLSFRIFIDDYLSSKMLWKGNGKGDFRVLQSTFA